jgi:hypothetical protein
MKMRSGEPNCLLSPCDALYGLFPFGQVCTATVLHHFTGRGTTTAIDMRMMLEGLSFTSADSSLHISPAVTVLTEGIGKAVDSGAAIDASLVIIFLDAALARVADMAFAADRPGQEPLSWTTWVHRRTRGAIERGARVPTLADVYAVLDELGEFARLQCAQLSDLQQAHSASNLALGMTDTPLGGFGDRALTVDSYPTRT